MKSIQGRRFWFPTVMMVLCFSAVRAEDARIVSVEKIWDQGLHNAFTDLIRFRERWFCTFREGERHAAGEDGRIRVITSPDGEDWESAALLTTEGVDLRDPKLSRTPDDRLLLVAGGSIYIDDVFQTRVPRVAFSRTATSGPLHSLSWPRSTGSGASPGTRAPPTASPRWETGRIPAESSSTRAGTASSGTGSPYSRTFLPGPTRPPSASCPGTR